MQVLKVEYWKVKTEAWVHFFVVDPRMLALFFKYKQETEQKHGGTSRVFWQYRNGRHHGQPLGKAWFGAFPKRVARLLGCANPDGYAGHSVCRSGATAAANAGATLVQLKQWGGWKSDAVAQLYVA